MACPGANNLTVWARECKLREVDLRNFVLPNFEICNWNGFQFEKLFLGEHYGKKIIDSR